jgi:hypothetical protein
MMQRSHVLQWWARGGFTHWHRRQYRRLGTSVRVLPMPISSGVTCATRSRHKFVRSVWAAQTHQQGALGTAPGWTLSSEPGFYSPTKPARKQWVKPRQGLPPLARAPMHVDSLPSALRPLSPSRPLPAPAPAPAPAPVDVANPVPCIW